MKYRLLSGIVLMALPAGALASSGADGSAATRMECDRLISVLEQRSPAEAHDALQRMRVHRAGNQYQACVETAQSGQGRNVQVGRIIDMEVFNKQGVQIGDVDRVVRGDDQRIYVFATFRGPRWPGNKQVALPLEEMTLQDGKLLISGVGEDELHRKPSVHQDTRTYTALDNDATASITVASPTETGSAGQSR